MKRRVALMFSLLVLMAAMLSVPAFADMVTITLTDPVQYAAIPSVVSFTATITAPDSNTAAIYLNGDSFNVDSPLTVDDSAFSATPAFLNPGDSWTGLLFVVDVPSNATYLATYTGYFSILGGSTSSSDDPISNVAAFQITAVPEPGSLMLLGSGVLGVFGVVRRKL